jgi:2-polyprenyl-3-methyl-5-hydroxy-6-metoxy-1,4-benzoquinol methylase
MVCAEMVPVKACWICNHEKLTHWNKELFDMTWQVDPVIKRYHQRDFWLVRCSECGFIQPEALPEESDFFDRLYSKDRGGDWMELEYSSPYRDFIFRSVLQQLQKRLSEGSRKLLDVGSHVGRMLTLAKEHGFEASGIELNPAVAQFAARRTGLPVIQMNAHELARTGQRYDAISLLDVLEHIPQPLSILKDLRELLVPGGVIAVKVPHGLNQWRKEKFRTLLGKIPAPWIATNLVHVNHFNINSLKMALANAGFQDVTFMVGGPEYPPSKGTWLAKIGLFFRWLCYRFASLPGMLRSPFAFNLQAFARVPK